MRSGGKIGARLTRVLPRSTRRATAVGQEGRRSGVVSVRVARRKRAVRARTSRGEIGYERRGQHLTFLRICTVTTPKLVSSLLSVCHVSE